MSSNMNKYFASNFRARLDASGHNQADVARRLDVSKSSVCHWINGDKMPRWEQIVKLAQFFRCEPSDLIDNPDASVFGKASNIFPLEKKKIPLIGEIACGSPILAEENIADYLYVLSETGGDFALRCSGDSMINANIGDGDIVIFKEQPLVENGQIAAVLIDDFDTTATLKRVYLNGDVLQLVAENAAFPPLVFVGSQIDTVRIIGRAVAVVKPL